MVPEFYFLTIQPTQVEKSKKSYVLPLLTLSFRIKAIDCASQKDIALNIQLIFNKCLLSA